MKYRIEKPFTEKKELDSENSDLDKRGGGLEPGICLEPNKTGTLDSNYSTSNTFNNL